MSDLGQPVHFKGPGQWRSQAAAVQKPLDDSVLNPDLSKGSDAHRAEYAVMIKMAHAQEPFPADAVEDTPENRDLFAQIGTAVRGLPAEVVHEMVMQISRGDVPEE